MTPGTLLLVPNALDLGAEEVALGDVLPDGVIRRAAALRHWAAEDARSTRAFLKRVAALTPLAVPLQAIARWITRSAGRRACSIWPPS